MEVGSGKKMLPLWIIFLIGFQRFQVTVGITTVAADATSSDPFLPGASSLPVSLPLSSASSSSSSSQSVFEGETLSPRTVNTKYGILRGTLIYTRNSYDKSSGNFFPSPSSSSTSSKSSTANKNQGNGENGGSQTAWKSVEVFLGVPYATAPIGSLRFMPPVTPTHWRGVRLANKLSHVCPQKFPPELKQYLSYPGSSSSSSSSSSRSTGRPSTLSSSSSGSSSFSSSSGSSSSSHQKPEGTSGGGSRIGHLVRMAPFLRNHSEDCLYLNIYAPFTPNPSSSPTSSSSSTFSSSSSTSSTGHGGIKNKQLLPVVVFIHGDSFDWGSGNSYDGTILASFGNVVVITLNYRLGAFGFLPSFVDGSPRGNYGLMDQVAALHWIQENIQDFGGDPNNVTLAGHGHGAACVHLLMMSPMASTSLFTRAIVMSGSALSPWAIARDSETYAKVLGKSVNCLTSDSSEMTDCLRSKRADELLDVDLKVPDFLTSFGPIIDGIVVTGEPKESVLNPDGSVPENLRSQSNTGINSLNHGDPRIPTTPLVPFDLLFGITKVETPPMFTPMEEKSGIDIKRRDRILRTLVRNLFDYHQQVIFLTLINEYSDWSRPSDHPINLIDSLSDILSDGLVVSPLISLGDSNSRLASVAQSSLTRGRGGNHYSSPTSSQSSSSLFTSPSTTSQLLPGSSNTRSYFYVFSYQGKEEVSFASPSSSTSSSSFSSSSRSGCIHGDELPFLFGAPLFNDLMPFKKTSNGGSFGHFPTSNYSKTESTLSEAVMMYWTNFVKFGDPNIWPHELVSSGDRAKTRFENVYWPQYDSTQRRYLMIGMKPKVRDHYHSHRMSYWLNLFPHLQSSSESLITKSFTDSNDQSRPSSSSSAESTEASYYYYKHHLLPDHENPSTYDGIVREISLRFFDTPASLPSSSSVHSSMNTSFSLSKNHWNKSSLQSSSGQIKQGGTGINTSNSRAQVTGSNDTKQHLTGSSSSSNSNSSPGVTQINGIPGGSINKSELATPISMEVQPGSYSTALTITITIGVSLLILNMLLFFGLYYHMDRRKDGQSGTSRNNGNLDQGGVGTDESDHNHSQTSSSQLYHTKNRNRNTVTFNEKLDNSDEMMILKQDPFIVASPLTDLTNQNNSNEEFQGMELDPYGNQTVPYHAHNHSHLLNHFHHSHNHHQHSPIVMDSVNQVYDVNTGSINDNDSLRRNSYRSEGRALIVSANCDSAPNTGILSYHVNHHSSSSSSPSIHSHPGYCSNNHSNAGGGYVTDANGQVIFVNGQSGTMERIVESQDQRSVRKSMDGLVEEINT